MRSRRLVVPAGTFAPHARPIGQRVFPHQFASSLAAPSAELWHGPQEPNTRLGKAITGGMEWQTSAYYWNKQNIKTFPTAAANVEKLIEAYVTMKKVNNEGKDVRAIRTALAARRKSVEKIYVSKPRIKDFGHRIELTVFVFDGKEAAQNSEDNRMRGRDRDDKGRESAASKSKRSPSDVILDPAQQAGLQSLIARIYRKPVELKMIKLQRPQLDADILSAYVAQRLADRRNTPRRTIRDATWKTQLPSAEAVERILQAKHQRVPTKFSFTDFTVGNSATTNATSIIDKLALSQVSSVEVEAAGRLTRRLTANRSQRKMARRGTTTKRASLMIRGFRKAHIQKGFASGKRRVGQFGIHVRLGHV